MPTYGPGYLPEITSALPYGITAGFVGKHEMIDKFYGEATDRQVAAQHTISWLTTALDRAGQEALFTVAPYLKQHSGHIWRMEDGVMIGPHYGLKIDQKLREDLSEVHILRPSGDAVIVNLANLRHKNFNLMGPIGDCLMLIIKSDEHLALVHISNQTEFGWTSVINGTEVPAFQGSILRRVLAQMSPNPEVWIMPHIGAGCWCYEYTQTDELPHAGILEAVIRDVHPNVEHDGLWRDRPDDHKRDIRWGDLFHRILVSLGVAENKIHPASECTLCHYPAKYYSDRGGRNGPGLERYKRNFTWLAFRC